METLVTKKVSLVLRSQFLGYGRQGENNGEGGRIVYAIWYPVGIDG